MDVKPAGAVIMGSEAVVICNLLDGSQWVTFAEESKGTRVGNEFDTVGQRTIVLLHEVIFFQSVIQFCAVVIHIRAVISFLFDTEKSVGGLIRHLKEARRRLIPIVVYVTMLLMVTDAIGTVIFAIIAFR